jgi:hypothetical protein
MGLSDIISLFVRGLLRMHRIYFATLCGACHPPYRFLTLSQTSPHGSPSNQHVAVVPYASQGACTVAGGRVDQQKGAESQCASGIWAESARWCTMNVNGHVSGKWICVGCSCMSSTNTLNIYDSILREEVVNPNIRVLRKRGEVLAHDRERRGVVRPLPKMFTYILCIYSTHTKL